MRSAETRCTVPLHSGVVAASKAGKRMETGCPGLTSSMLAGATTAGAALPLRGLALPSGSLATAFTALGRPSAGESPLQAYAARSITDLHRTVDTFGKDVDAKAMTTGKQGALAAQLDVVARCVEAGAPARVYSVSLGGFDTHADERGTQQRLHTEVDQAVSGFLTRMEGTERGRGVVVMAYSEFGRRVAANANEGTDHGTAGPLFVAGAPVRGGFVGEQPSLTDLDQGDLKATTDFRDVYSTMLSDVMSFAGGPGAGSFLSLVMVLGWRRVVADRCDGTCACPSSPLLLASVNGRGPAAMPSDPSITASSCSEVPGLAMLGPGTVWPRPGFRPAGGDGRI